jgi:hypothetical protein
LEDVAMTEGCFSALPPSASGKKNAEDDVGELKKRLSR